jgi:hypothetical protein
LAHEIGEVDFYRDDFIKAIAEEASGENALEYFAGAIPHQGFAPSKGYDAIVQSAAGRLQRWGLEQVQVLSSPADGDSYVWALRTEPAWDVEDAELTLIRPEQRTLARFAENRVCLGRFSQPSDVQAPLVHVGQGITAQDYADTDVRGKIVLAHGTPPAVFQQAVWERGALGLVWYRMAGRSSSPDAAAVVYTIPWRSFAGKPLSFCFSLSYNAGRALVGLLETGQEVVLRAVVHSSVHPSKLLSASGLIRGWERPDEEVWFLGHCDHRNTPGINNLTGFSSTLEIARVLATLIRKCVLARPRRSIRFFFGAEHSSVLSFFHAYPGHEKRVFGAINQDMVGLYRDKTGASLALRRTPHSTPHLINDVAEYFADYMSERNQIDMSNVDILAAREDSGFSDPILSPKGSRASMDVHASRFWGPSDQEDLMDGSLRVPTVCLADWPDPFFHTDLDTIELADPTQLRRVITMAGAMGYFLAQLCSENLPFLIVHALGKARCRGGQALSRAVQALANAGVDAVAIQYHEACNCVRQSWWQEKQAVSSLDLVAGDLQHHQALQEALSALDRDQQEALRTVWSVAVRKCGDAGVSTDLLRTSALQGPAWESWVPHRVQTVRGPVNLRRSQYGQWWLYDRLGNLDFLALPLLRAGYYYAYEALNCVDGTRTVREIRDLVSAEYGPVPVEHLRDYFDMLEKAGVIEWHKPAAAASH